MGRPSKLTPAQWVAAKRRWEGADKPGFEWLRRECVEAFGDAPSRPAMQQMAAEGGWKKGGEVSATMAPVAALPRVAKVTHSSKLTQAPLAKVTPPPEIADEVVDAPAPALPRKVGRPTAYRPEFAEQIVDFFDKQPFTEVDVLHPNGLVKRQRMATDPPMLADFAKSIGVSKTTVDNWATALDDGGHPRHALFFEAYARAREMQEALFVRGGALGLYDPRFLSMMMKNLCGWQDQPTRAVEVAPISKEELERTYVRVMEAAHDRMDALMKERRSFLQGLDD